MAKQKRGQGPSIVDEVAQELEKLNNMGELQAEDLVEYADKVGKFLESKGLKTSQIRKFLDAVNQIKARSFRERFDFEREAILLRPKLAWAAGGQKKQVEPLMRVLDPCMKRVKDEKDFANFARFVEAIVAYHRFYGGD